MQKYKIGQKVRINIDKNDGSTTSWMRRHNREIVTIKKYNENLTYPYYIEESRSENFKESEFEPAYEDNCIFANL